MAPADDGLTLREINFPRVFPFLQIFRAFRVATHLSKLVLAVMLLIALYLGGRIMDAVWSKAAPAHMAHAGDLGVFEIGKTVDQAQGVFITFFSHQARTVNNVAASVAYADWRGVVNSIFAFFVDGPRWLFLEHPVFGLIFTAWFLVVWSIFGGAICRIAAVHVARDEKIAVRQALRFSIGKVLSFVFAPVIPLAIFFALGAALALVGLVLLHVPYVGPIVVGGLFIVAIAAAFVMALVLLGMVGGFNLMYPTIAVEGSDSFDAISRSFSYVYARPWRMVFYTLLAVLYGALTYLFVRFFVFLLLSLAHYFVGWFMSPAGVANRWDVLWPWQPFDWQWLGGRLAYEPKYQSLNWGQKAGAGLLSFWVYMTITLVGAYAVSFYFSANTIIYFLLRREVDATELDDVYVEEIEEEFSETAPAPKVVAETPSPAPTGAEIVTPPPSAPGAQGNEGSPI
jgi:hypothetical protein